jgi:hypothetical protein
LLYQDAGSEDAAMKSKRFERLVESLDEVRARVSSGRFAGRINKIEIAAEAPDEPRGGR